jgi:hypothetical protein
LVVLQVELALHCNDGGTIVEQNKINLPDAKLTNAINAILANSEDLLKNWRKSPVSSIRLN